MISLCTPTRGRPQRFERMVRSAQALGSNFEVVALRDADDLATYPQLASVKYRRGPRPMNGRHVEMSGLWAKAWKYAKGDIAMLCADDVVFETPGWDEQVERAFASVPDRIVMVSTRNGQDDRPLLPFVSREWIDAAGFTPSDYPGWMADEWIWSIAAEIGRVIFLDDVTIRHEQFGLDSTYLDAMRARDAAGGLEAMRRRFYGAQETKKRDALAAALRKITGGRKLPLPDAPWIRESLDRSAEARMHQFCMERRTLVAVHCYSGDRGLVRRHMPVYKHHGAKVLVLSPEDKPVEIRGVECRQAGRAAYFGQTSLDRQREHLKLLLQQPYDFFLLNDADSFCIDPTIPRYLYEGAASGIVYSNEVGEWRPHKSPYPKIAMQPPYFLTRESIARMVAISDRPEVLAHPVTPYIDWYMLALTSEAGLKHESFLDGVSFPAWRFGYIPETQELGHDYQHKYDPNGNVRGDDLVEGEVGRGAVMVHAVKHKDVFERLLKAHANWKRRGAPTPHTITMEEYARQRQQAAQSESYVIELGRPGMVDGDSIRI